MAQTRPKTCETGGCTNLKWKSRWCEDHYDIQQAKYNKQARERRAKTYTKVCVVDDCGSLISAREVICRYHRENFICNKCKTPKKHDSLGLCTSCYRKTEHMSLTIEKNRLIYVYNLTFSQFQSLLDKQDGKCAGCNKEHTDIDKLHIDHDHSCCPRPVRGHRKTCGKCIRGLLCGDCNRLIGLAKDNPSTLRSLADYLDQVQG